MRESEWQGEIKRRDNRMMACKPIGTCLGGGVLSNLGVFWILLSVRVLDAGRAVVALSLISRPNITTNQNSITETPPSVEQADAILAKFGYADSEAVPADA